MNVSNTDTNHLVCFNKRLKNGPEEDDGVLLFFNHSQSTVIDAQSSTSQQAGAALLKILTDTDRETGGK